MVSTKLFQLNFKHSKADSLLFHYHKCGVTIFVLVYVDDIIVASSSKGATEAIFGDLLFHLENLGNLYYFLGINVKRTSNGLVRVKRNMLMIFSRRQVCQRVHLQIHLCLV
jgi:hypothetical protein